MPLTDVTRKLMSQPDIREGDWALEGIVRDIMSFVNGETGVLPFGRGMIYSATSTGIMEKNIMTLPTTAGQVIRGITLASDTIERLPGVTVDAAGNVGYPPNPTGNNTGIVIEGGLAVKGVVAVIAKEAVVKGDAVSCIITAGATRGMFAKTADAARIACPTTWEWLTTTALDRIGLIWIK